MSQSQGGGGQGNQAATGIGNGTGNNGNGNGGADGDGNGNANTGAATASPKTTTTYNNGLYTPDSERTSTTAAVPTQDSTTPAYTPPTRTTSTSRAVIPATTADAPTTSASTEVAQATTSQATLKTSSILSSLVSSSIISSSIAMTSTGLGIAGSTCSTGSDCQSGICRSNICTGIVPVSSSFSASSSMLMPSTSASSNADVSQSSTQSTSHTPAIVGGIIGAIAAMALIGFLIRFCMTRRSKERDYEPDVKPMQWPHGIEDEFVGTKHEEPSYAMSEVSPGQSDGVMRTNTLAYGGAYGPQTMSNVTRAPTEREPRSAFATAAPENAGWTRFQNSASTESLNRTSPEYEQKNPFGRGVQLYDAPLASKSLRIANTTDNMGHPGNNNLTVPGTTLTRQNTHELGTVSPHLQREFRGRLAEVSAAHLENEAQAKHRDAQRSQGYLARSDTVATAPTNYYLPSRSVANDEDAEDQYPKLAHMNRVSATIYPDDVPNSGAYDHRDGFAGASLGPSSYGKLGGLDRSGTIMSTASSYYGNSPEKARVGMADSQSAYQDDAVRYSVQSFDSDRPYGAQNLRDTTLANTKQNARGSQPWTRHQLGVVHEN